MKMANFFNQYYIDPIYQGTGYNIYNTVTYAIIFVILLIGIYKLLKKTGIKIDKKFIFGVSPFIVLGGVLRALQDASPVVNPLLVTPLIYILIFFVALALLYISLVAEKLSKKITYEKFWFASGAILSIIGMAMMSFTNFYGAGLIAGIFAGWVVAFLIAKKLAQWKFQKLNEFLSKENMLILLAHMFDATTTFVSIQFFPYYEQHVVPSFFIGAIGPIAMFLLKLPVVALVLYALDRELKKEEEKKNIVKLAVLVLGLGPGLRNFFRLFMGV
jgi:uncharacterized membrane protein